MRPTVHAPHPGDPTRSLCGRGGLLETHLSPVTCWSCARMRTLKQPRWTVHDLTDLLARALSGSSAEDGR
jgi:hypothetical protein